MPSCSEMKWVTDALPLDKQVVMITVQSGRSSRFVIRACWDHGGRRWLLANSNQVVGAEYQVIAWSHLPPPFSGTKGTAPWEEQK